MKRRQANPTGSSFEERSRRHVPIPLGVYMDIQMIRAERSSARNYAEILDYARRWDLRATVRWLEGHRMAYIEGSHVGFALMPIVGYFDIIEEETPDDPQT